MNIGLFGTYFDLIFDKKVEPNSDNVTLFSVFFIEVFPIVVWLFLDAHTLFPHNL